jgi:hypothetical protein
MVMRTHPENENGTIHTDEKRMLYLTVARTGFIERNVLVDPSLCQLLYGMKISWYAAAATH